MESIIKKIEEAGIKTAEGPIEGTVRVFPYYRNNFGFFLIKGPQFETVLIKGIYKDNLRHVSGESPYKNRTLNEIVQACADIERTLRHPVILDITFDDKDVYYIYAAEKCEWAQSAEDMRDPKILSPVTPVEKSLGKERFINEKHLFIRSPFAEILPDVLSPVFASIASGVPDIFNPLFVSCSIKTQSPSIKVLFGRLFLNSANANTIVPAFKQTTDFFLLNYMPSVFNKIKKPLFGVPDDSDMKITDEEIELTIKDISESIDSLKPEDIFSDEFIELLALSVMAWEMTYLRIWQSSASLHKSIGRDITEAMKHIYMTRSDSILNSDPGELNDLFDPACAPAQFKGLQLEYITAEDMYKTLPSAKRITFGKGKYTEKLSACHKYFRMRDELFILFSALTGKLRSFLLDIGNDLKGNNIIVDENDIFYFEMKEIKKILDDSFHGSIPFTINFRKWQNARYAAMCLTNMLYEKDIEEAEELSRAQIEKSENDGIIPCLGINNKDIETDNYAFHRSFRLSELKDMDGCDAAVTESASLLSFTAEYCMVKDIPLYTGARFANLLLKGKKIKTSKDEIHYE